MHNINKNTDSIDSSNDDVINDDENDLDTLKKIMNENNYFILIRNLNCFIRT